MHRIVLVAPTKRARAPAGGLARRAALGLLLGAVGPSGAATAQPYGYDAPPPPGARRGVPTGFNCEAPQPGFFGGIRPYSCPLPGARPLGARCFCNQPVSAFSGPQPALVGSVVP